MKPVVFDCDGVLIDSEALSWEVWRNVVRPYGVEIPDELARRLTGRTEIDTYEALSNGRLPPFDDFWATIAAETARVFDARLQAFEDAADVLDHLEGRTRLAVASSSPRHRLNLSLRATELDRFFEVVVAGDEVEQGKPAPDLFLTAADRLGIAPSDCVAVEDSPLGIAAARAAGMSVMAVDRGWFPTELLSAADVVVPRLIPAAFAGTLRNISFS